MQTDAAGSYSGVTDGNSLNSGLFALGYSDSLDGQTQNHVMAGFALPSTLGEATINFTRGPVADEFWTIQTGKDTVRDLSIGTSYHQISSTQYMEGTNPPAGRYSMFENHEKLATSTPFSRHFESPKTVLTSGSSFVNSTSDSTNYIFEGLPFPGEVIGRTGAQTFRPTGNSILDEWMLTEQEELDSHNPGPSRFSKELSLSLATSRPSVVHGTSIQEQCSEMSCSSVTSYILHRRSENMSCGSRNNFSSNSNSYKPLQISPLLSRSSFFHATQEILAEIAFFALENFDQMSCSATGIGNDASFSSSGNPGRRCSTIGFSGGLDADNRFVFQNNNLHEREVESKKKHLFSLLQMVEYQFNRCLDEIHTVIYAFHAVTELDPNLHARFALPTISLMYRNLRERISRHILAMGAHISQGDTRENSFESSFVQKQWAYQQLTKREQLWRPQRGLPERSVCVLRAWMFQNFLHPYPKDSEKRLLALKSGLTRSQTGVQLVYKCTCSSLETDDRGNVCRD